MSKFENMKKDELLQYCTDNNIKAFKSWNKSKIISSIKELLTTKETNDLSGNKIKACGHDLLIDEILEHYIKFKPLHFICKALNIEDVNFNIIENLENDIKVGDMFLYKIQQNILNNLKNGDYNYSINKINEKYNINTNHIEVYNIIMNNLKYSYELNKNNEVSTTRENNIKMNLQLLASKENDANYYERIEKMINKHDRNYLTLFADNTENKRLLTIFYGNCKIEKNQYLDYWEINFYKEDNIINSFNLDNVKYDMLKHDLYMI